MLDRSLSGPPYFSGLISFIRGDFQRALIWLSIQEERYSQQDLADKDEYYFPTIYMEALTHAFAKDLDRAAEGFQHLLVINADDSRSRAYYTDLAWMYFQQGKFQEIRDIMEGGMLLGDDSVPEEEREVDIGGYARYPDNPWVLNMYGLALHNLGESEQAYELFETAYEEVQKLTVEDWVAAYPGNDPSEAQIGLAEFKRSIETNIGVAKEAIKQR